MSMENLDPLRQKPDFEQVAVNANGRCKVNDHEHDCNCGAFEEGCEHVWNSHVEPLMKELDAKDKEMEGLIDIHHANDAELESDRDKFAIGFAVFVELHDNDPRNRYKSTPELLEMYKESLLN